MSCFGLHRWGKWGAPFVVQMLNMDNEPSGKREYQQRTCKRCGKTTERRVG